jgi:hypothetical protein
MLVYTEIQGPLIVSKQQFELLTDDGKFKTNKLQLRHTLRSVTETGVKIIDNKSLNLCKTMR